MAQLVGGFEEARNLTFLNSVIAESFNLDPKL